MLHDLKSLTSLRFFAAFWVFLFHLRLRTDFGQGWFSDFIANGARGVDFFFILSGFVILHVYDSDFSRWQFLLKRFARIFPLHAVMTALFIALAVIGSNPVEGVWQSVLLLHGANTTDGLVLNGPSWTLSADMFAYLLFALIPFRQTWIIAAACVASFLAAHILSVSLGKTAFLHMTWDYGVVRIVPLFLLGMLLRRLAPYISEPLAVAGGIVGIVLLAWIGSMQNAGYAILAPFALLIVSGARLSNWKFFTNSKLAVYLGEISYSTYMIHIFLLAVFFDYLPKLGIPTPHWSVISVALLAASSVSYHLIEVPARRWINAQSRFLLFRHSER
ncbi:peptidoglycan/LPS O-acetylase OafA/YrhL [Sulfitobacter undariae]|uniref:Peptidoglycan/LPS O-acetylase OafA/YrhL n=1 Tax=Sulfitobacter undariae TaxID=1563671 RepID=A0A7W6H0I0_9RHOB|nr:acyltransferase [Sulfitobacter undariae]MBB3993618.1 peptidoglycan/LPS O-acetylase OafA/YrhL [Sulfitobacter undariae]